MFAFAWNLHIFLCNFLLKEPNALWKYNGVVHLFQDPITINFLSIGIYPDQMLTNGGVICGCACTAWECDYMRTSWCACG